MSKPIKQLIEYTYKGISVVAAINHDSRTISLVENAGSGYAGSETQYQVKKWAFGKRGMEYMESWNTVLDAMKFAISEARKELQKTIDADRESAEDMIDHVAENLQEILSGRKSHSPSAKAKRK